MVFSHILSVRHSAYLNLIQTVRDVVRDLDCSWISSPCTRSFACCSFLPVVWQYSSALASTLRTGPSVTCSMQLINRILQRMVPAQLCRQSVKLISPSVTCRGVANSAHFHADHQLLGGAIAVRLRRVRLSTKRCDVSCQPLSLHWFSSAQRSAAARG